MSDTVYDSSLTAKRIASRKWILLVCCLLAAAADAFVVAALAAGGFAAVYFVCPCILFALDIFFLAGIVVSNFRFRYSALWVTVYLALALVLMALTVFLDMGRGEGTAVTTAAAVFWIAVHVLAVAAILLAALHAAKLKRLARSGAAATCLALLLAAACLYGFFIFRNGFFGQGFSGGVRTLSFTYDEENAYYEVTGVLDGRGDTVVVPETFNGEEVGAFDCGVLLADGVAAVRFEGDADIRLTGLSALAGVGDTLQVYADKEYIDDYRAMFFGVSGTSSVTGGARRIANGLRPQGLAENEIYVTFSYTDAAYEIVGGDILPTWFGTRGQAFDLSAYREKYPYLAHADLTSDEDLHWAFSNFGGYILSGAAGGTAVPEEGETLSESVDGAVVGFEKVFAVTVGEDNDTLYESPDSYRFSAAGGSTLQYRYAVSSTADALTAQIPAREGFTVAWQYRAQNGSLASFSSLSQVLSQTDTANALTIYPVWALESASVSIGSESGRFSYIYGDTVTLTAQAQSPVDGMDVAYAWTAQGEPAGEQASLPLGIPETSASGVYGVAVTLSSDTITSLTATASASVSVTVAKKPLRFIWTLPQGGDLVYSGTYKDVLCELAAGQAVGSDEIVFTYDYEDTGVRDAGDYTSGVTLGSATAENYSVEAASAARSFTISPYTVAVEWGSRSFVYDGTMQRPELPQVSGVPSDGMLDVEVAGGGTNAGTYTATASIGDTNYLISNPEYEFTIERRGISVVSWDDTELSYNGRVQYPKITDVENAVAGEKADLLASGIVYTVNGGMNAGEYTVSAALPADGNYFFSDSPVSHSYTISKAAVSVTRWTSGSFVYDGSQQIPAVSALSGVVSGETNTVLNSLTYIADGGAENGGVSAGSHTVEAVLPQTGNYVFSSPQTTSYSIAKRSASLIWQSGRTLTYSGEQQGIEVTGAGQLSGALLAELLSGLSYTGYGTDAGSYTMRASVPSDSNFTVSGASCSYTIAKREIGLVWSADDLPYNGRNQRPSVTSVTNAVAGEESSIAFTYSNEGGTAAGTYTVTASLTPSAGANYTVASAGHTYTISKLGVVLSWQEERSLVYNGAQQGIKVVGADFSDEELLQELLSDLSYTGYGTNVGSYTMRAALSSNSNFAVVGGAECAYTIIPQTVTLAWESDNSTFAYTGGPISPAAVCGVPGAEIVYEYLNERGTVLQGAPSAPGTYTVIAGIRGGNYAAEEIEMRFTILQEGTI